jgi:dTDP-4-amino-4,6-dideoxygalactose transaminase
MARVNGSYLVEDAAQSLGRVPNGKHPGTLGDFGLLSFGRGKPLPVGKGGALVSKDHPAILNAIRWDNAGMGYEDWFLCAAAKILSKPAFYWLPEMLPLGLGKTVFDPGFSVNNISLLTERITIDALTILDELNAHRRRTADLYTKLLNENWKIYGDEHAISAVRHPVMLPFQALPPTLKRLGIRRMYPHAIGAEKSIMPYLKSDIQPTPGAMEISKRLFTLPTHLGIDDRMAMHISRAVHSATARGSYQ